MARRKVPGARVSEGGLSKGPWTAEEDAILASFIKANGEGNWRTLPKRAGLQRCRKSCRLRWMNYLRPDLKRGNFSPDEDELIIKLHSLLGNRWSMIAGRIPGRTDNEIKNYWNSRLRRKLKAGLEAAPLSFDAPSLSPPPALPRVEAASEPSSDATCKFSEPSSGEHYYAWTPALGDAVSVKREFCAYSPESVLLLPQLSDEFFSLDFSAISDSRSMCFSPLQRSVVASSYFGDEFW